MSRYAVEFTADRDTAASIAVNAATAGQGTVLSQPVPDGRTRITFRYEAPDNYLARTVALAVQGDAPAEARIRRDSLMFPGTWFDLNEES